jgi:RIO kinase 1
MPRPAPSWLLVGDHVDDELGTLKTGKEAEIRLVERSAPDGRSHLLVEKRYRPKTVTHKGQLEELGLTRAASFRNDVAYREARTFRDSRDRRAVAKMSRYGKSLVRADWVGHEHDVLLALWEADVPVPYPVETDRESRVLMQYLGDAEGAAPRLAQARLDRPTLDEAWRQLRAALASIVGAGWVHADLSAYNLLWWEERLWVIDVPQAVDLLGSTNGFDLLHRDVLNVCAWFASKGVPEAHDPDAVFAELL